MGAKTVMGPGPAKASTNPALAAAATKLLSSGTSPAISAMVLLVVGAGVVMTGIAVGLVVGLILGAGIPIEGVCEGDRVGTSESDGNFDASVGISDGESEGIDDGKAEGMSEGKSDCHSLTKVY